MQNLMRGMCLLLLAALLVSCNTPGTFLTPRDALKPLRVPSGLAYPEFIPITPGLFACDRDSYVYRVGAKDILTVIVWNHPELTIPSMVTTSENVNVFTNFNVFNNNTPGILVDENGEIFFPLAGQIKVSQLTVNEIRKRLTRRLYEYFQNPQVSVRVSAFRSKYVYVVGEVVKQGMLPITDMALTAMDAINQSGGIDKQSSDAHYIYIIRGSFIRPKVYWLDASSPGGILMAENFLLEPRDVLIVTTASVVRWSRVVNNLLPTIQTFTQPPVNMRTDR